MKEFLSIMFMQALMVDRILMICEKDNRKILSQIHLYV
jgi:hypothetical protein